jgi:fumarylacetoacetate (FAA) hydrolase family protein
MDGDAMTTPTLVGRIWDAEIGGPRIVAIAADTAYDITDEAPTMSALLERPDAATLVSVNAMSSDRRRWPLNELTEAAFLRTGERTRLISPIDLQVIKACGVTFVESMIERVIEERSAGDSSRASEVRARVVDIIGGSLSDLVPGSAAAAKVRESLIGEGMWSQYLEVGIGADPEVFTKAPVLSSVGTGASVGIPSFSDWNNPEPELVLLVNSSGVVKGATLGNDVNLRDVEGRSALLLGMAKDNNASTAIGPLIRLFDTDFTIEDLRNEEISLEVVGVDGFHMNGRNSLAQISRPFEALVNAVIGRHHQYPDGFALFTGTLFAPTQDRDGKGKGFTHHIGDVVTISSPHLGKLTNIVERTEQLPPWEFGIRAFIDYATRQKTRPHSGSPTVAAESAN